MSSSNDCLVLGQQDKQYTAESDSLALPADGSDPYVALLSSPAQQALGCCPEGQSVRPCLCLHTSPHQASCDASLDFESVEDLLSDLSFVPGLASRLVIAHKIYDYVFKSNPPVSLLHLMPIYDTIFTLGPCEPSPTASPALSTSDTSNVEVPPDMEAYNPSERELWCSARAYHRRLQLVSSREGMSADSITKLRDWMDRLERLERFWGESGGTVLTVATDDVVAESWKSYETKDTADREKAIERYNTKPRSFGEWLKWKITTTTASTAARKGSVRQHR